ncbi:hypothetical protein AB0I84_36055 [Streptomyces spectabilis]|uniref:hypothetical protein n=1 Tax=Streptomyces spectabilis TaxID=68270 RepID=UPI0033C09405
MNSSTLPGGTSCAAKNVANFSTLSHTVFEDLWTLQWFGSQRAANSSAKDRCTGSATGSVEKSYSFTRPAVL